MTSTRSGRKKQEKRRGGPYLGPYGGKSGHQREKKKGGVRPERNGGRGEKNTKGNEKDWKREMLQ